MTKRLDVADKRLRGTLRPVRERGWAPRAGELVRITEPIPPPGEFSDALKRQWVLHQDLLIYAGTFAPTDMRAFVALCRCAELLERAYEAALLTGPTVVTGGGSTKTSAAWSMWLAIDAEYLRHLDGFGLRPHSRGRVPVLPSPQPALRVVR